MIYQAGPEVRRVRGIQRGGALFASNRAARGDVIIWITAKNTAGTAISMGSPDAATNAAAMLNPFLLTDPEDRGQEHRRDQLGDDGSYRDLQVHARQCVEECGDDER